jgi:hypothetical protein
MSLPLSIDRQLARQPDDGARAVYLNEQIDRHVQARFDDVLEALEHRKRFVEGRVRESIKQAERKL